MGDQRRMRGYVLAGGRSSRMGTDKAEVIFRGQTMLEIAVRSMAEVCAEVVVIGERARVPAGVRSIPDTSPGCGPMGGIEAALRDCQRVSAEFAVFLPVDMPLLPAGLLRALISLWRQSSTARIAVVVADGRLQPLVSLIHADVLPTLQAALARGDYKLQPSLRAAAGRLAEGLRVAEDAVFLQTVVEFGDRVVLTADGAALPWRPSDLEWNTRAAWFANLNTPEELRDAEGEPGTIRRRELGASQ